MPNVSLTCRMIRLRRALLFFASPKKSNQKKGDPTDLFFLRFSNEPHAVLMIRPCIIKTKTDVLSVLRGSFCDARQIRRES